MKRLTKLSIIFLIIMFSLIGTAQAVLNCNINIELSKTEVSKKEEFFVDINLANVQADKGIISLGATLDYDKEALELIKIEGKNGWETPSQGSFNESNGKMAITRSSVGQKDETVFTITFKVKDTNKKDAKISLKDIVVADGDKPVKISLVSKSVSIKENVQDSNKPGNDNSNNTSTNNNSSGNTNNNGNNNNSNGNINNNGNNNNLNGNANNNGNSNNLNSIINNNSNINTNSNGEINIKPNQNSIKKDNSIINTNLPYTGAKMSVIIIFIGLFILISVIFLLKIKFINKEK